MDLREVLPRVLPEAIAWAKAQEAVGAELGRPLNEHAVSIALAVGVYRPERIRLVRAYDLPWPGDPLLRKVAKSAGFLGSDTIGVTFGYSVFIRSGQDSPRVQAHEFRHVRQYEDAGSFSAFLERYFSQIASVGYIHADLEKDAKRCEKYGVP